MHKFNILCIKYFGGPPRTGGELVTQIICDALKEGYHAKVIGMAHK
ncbi:MAG: hypothetical protein QW837_09650 [Conexivisphaerales archaeon]